MERMTVKRSDGRWALANNDRANPMGQMEKIPIAIDRLAAYEDTGLMPEDIDALQKRERGLAEMLVNVSCGCVVPYTRLAELARAEKDGRLMVLPCKVEDMVWCISGAYKTISLYTVAGYLNDGFRWKVRMTKTIPSWVGNKTEHKYVAFNAFGKTVFLTREEAEAALKKREGADNETVR